MIIVSFLLCLLLFVFAIVSSTSFSVAFDCRWHLTHRIFFWISRARSRPTDAFNWTQLMIESFKIRIFFLLFISSAIGSCSASSVDSCIHFEQWNKTVLFSLTMNRSKNAVVKWSVAHRTDEHELKMRTFVFRLFSLSSFRSAFFCSVRRFCSRAMVFGVADFVMRLNKSKVQATWIIKFNVHLRRYYKNFISLFCCDGEICIAWSAHEWISVFLATKP